ncbi:MAG: TOBE domain-containing protein, partial [Trebonia sp.]
LREYAGRAFVLGLRPEDLAIASDDSVPAVTGEVDLIESLGSELLVHFSSDAKRARPAVLADLDSEENLPEAEVSARDGWVARLGARTAVRPGESVCFAPDLSHLHCFDPVSGDAIH